MKNDGSENGKFSHGSHDEPEEPWFGLGAKIMIVLMGVVVLYAWALLLWGWMNPV